MPAQHPVFLGIDLGWYGKPSGAAAFTNAGGSLRLAEVTRIADSEALLGWVERWTGQNTILAVDAPLVIPNEKGIRRAERELNRDWRRYHAGCHAANLGLPFAARVTAFSRALCALGFGHAEPVHRRNAGRWQLEVHPHAASVALFGLERILKYKRGLRADRARELDRLRYLLQTRLPQRKPRTEALRLPEIPARGDLKPVEDQLDAVLCAYIAAYWWKWGASRCMYYGAPAEGYIVVPKKGCDSLET
jgi:predicted RNase H-like nuclease